MYLHDRLLYHPQKCVSLFHNDNDRRSYPKESSDYDRDIVHYPGRTNPICRQGSTDLLQLYYPDVDEVQSIIRSLKVE